MTGFEPIFFLRLRLAPVPYEAYARAVHADASIVMTNLASPVTIIRTGGDD